MRNNCFHNFRNCKKTMCADYAFNQNYKLLHHAKFTNNFFDIQTKEVLATASMFGFVWILLCLL